MRRAGSKWFGCGLVLLVVLIALSACERSTGPAVLCYNVESLYPTGTVVSDTVAARTAFMAFLAHLKQTDGYPVVGWRALDYRRTAGTEYYRGTLYWGVSAWGVHVDGDSVETRMFRVRGDGTVVSMLGCI